ncbi:hypothetical protein BGZ97_003251 [Linnemannia gamsii]|uniref:ARM repeat-containing protein n=1 Tax=Linnemannia gamsii TaxID=64522 RepID=A0A9P6USG2_9FUNG|nr:hypothetical protein BGZ97_003251 [Linnemannia gamsii]
MTAATSVAQSEGYVAKETLATVGLVATELAQEFSIESLSAPAVKEAQSQIQTVALQMDGIRTQVSQIKDQLPGLNQQTAALLEGAEALEQMYKQIDALAIMVESVAATVQDVSTSMDQAERDLASSALQPLQAVLETLKMSFQRIIPFVITNANLRNIMSATIEHEDKVKELLQSLEDGVDVQPTHITDLTAAFVAAVAKASPTDNNSTVRQQQKGYLNHCHTILSKQLPTEDPTDDDTNALLQLQGAVLKSLLRLVMNDVPFVDAFIDSDVLADVLRLPSTVTSLISTVESSSKSTPLPTGPKPTRPQDLKPMAAILLSKSFETVSNKDHVRDKNTEIILTDIGSDKVKIRATGFQSLHLVFQADMAIGCGILAKEGLLNQHLKGAAAVALTKISLSESRKDPSVGMNGLDGASNQAPSNGSNNSAEEEAQLAKLFSTLLKDDKNDKSNGIQLNAVEGLAYASIQGPVKQLIISDKALLLSLFQLGEDTKNNPLKYGLIIIFNNLTAFRKRLSPEQEQMLKLKKMAGTLPKSESGRLQSQDDDPLDDEAVVNQRNITLTKLGIMPALHAIGHQASENIRQSLAQVLRNLITPPETRGLLQPQQPPASEATKTAATQALAKLSITLDPRLTFKNQRIPELVKPLIWLLESTDQLCQFESLMALTNLGSMGDVQVLSLIVQDGGIEKMENLQFSEHNLVRRAATEALCNMIFFEPVFELYSDPKQGKNKIHLMLALCDADDFMTRRAASGALAVLSTSPEVCKMIIAQTRGLEILRGLITLGVSESQADADEVEAKAIEDVMSDQEAAVVDHAVAVGRMDELRHRGAECFKNLITIGGKEISERIAAEGGIQQLAQLIQTSGHEAVRYCAMEALKAMSDQGIRLQK